MGIRLQLAPNMGKKTPWSKYFAGWLIRNAWSVTLCGVLLAMVGAYYSVFLYRNLKTEIEELLPTNARSAKDLTVLSDRLESVDYIAVLLFSKDAAATKRLVDAVVPKLSALPKDLVYSVEYRITDELKFFQDRLGLFMDVDDLQKVHKFVSDRIRYEKEFFNPLNIFPMEDRFPKPQLDFDSLKGKYARSKAYESFPDGGYYATPDGGKRIILVYLSGKHGDTQNAERLASEVKSIMNQANPASFAPDIELHYVGAVAEFLEERAALIADLELSTALVVIFCILAMLIYYKDVAATVWLCAAIASGTFWTFGIAYFLVGYLNANSAFLGSIVIGNGINFSLIFVARYIEERRRQFLHAEALETAIQNTATATFTAALAAGFSYGSLIVTQFRGFQQFGVIGLTGMILCWISSYTLLPALLTLGDRYFPRQYKALGSIKGLLSDRIARLVSLRPQSLVYTFAGVTVIALLAYTRFTPEFIETNLNKLRDRKSMSEGAGFYGNYTDVIFQHNLSPIVMLASSREKANEIAARLREKKKIEGEKSFVANVQVFQDFLPDRQAEKVAILTKIRRDLTPKIVNNLDPREQGWVKDFLKVEAVTPFSEPDLPKLVIRKFIERGGEVGRMVYVEPPMGELAWQSKLLIGFIEELRAVADSVEKGTPVAGQLPISADMVLSISNDGPKATAIAFASVILLVIFLFRNTKTILLCLTSLVLGVFWLGGLIFGFDLKVNFLNFIALPITFGIGVDYGVNIFQRYRIEGRGSILNVIRNTGGALMLASLTTIIGYSSLMIASNQAFVSFGTLAVLGELTCTTAAVVALPAYLHWRERKSPKIELADQSNVSSGASR